MVTNEIRAISTRPEQSVNPQKNSLFGSFAQKRILQNYKKNASPQLKKTGVHTRYTLRTTSVSHQCASAFICVKNY